MNPMIMVVVGVIITLYFLVILTTIASALVMVVNELGRHNLANLMKEYFNPEPKSNKYIEFLEKRIRMQEKF